MSYFKSPSVDDLHFTLSMGQEIDFIPTIRKEIVKEHDQREESSSEKPLFPHLEEKHGLPEQTEESVNFTRSFLHENNFAPSMGQELDFIPQEFIKQKDKQEIEQPQEEEASATDPKQTQPSESKKEPLIDFRKRITFEPETYTTDFEKKLMGTSGGWMVQVANSIFEMRANEQVDLLGAFERLNEKLRKTHAKQREVLEELAENAKLEDNWTSIQSILGYLGPMTSIVGGLGIAGIAAAFLPKELSAYSKEMGMTALTAATTLGQGLTSYQTNKLGAERFRIQAKANDIKFMRDKDKSKRTKALNAIKLSEPTETYKAVSKQLASEQDLKERIAQMLSSG